MWKIKLNLWLTPGHSCNSLPEIKKLQIQIESLCHSNFLALIVHKMFFKSTWVFFYLGEIQRLAIALISSPLYWKNPKIKGWGEKPKTSSIFFFFTLVETFMEVFSLTSKTSSIFFCFVSLSGHVSDERPIKRGNCQPCF